MISAPHGSTNPTAASGLPNSINAEPDTSPTASRPANEPLPLAPTLWPPPQRKSARTAGLAASSGVHGLLAHAAGLLKTPNHSVTAPPAGRFVVSNVALMPFSFRTSAE